MAKHPSETREFTDAGVSSTRSMRDAMGDTDNYRTQQRLLATGNEVTLRTKGGEPMVFGEQENELYLDNGFVTPGFYSAGATVEQAQHQATASNGDTTSSYLTVKNKLKPPFIPKQFKDLFKSFSTKGSATGTPKADKVDSLKAKNLAIITCPPAMFTGLMRRYVSALYGKKVTDAYARELSVTDIGAYGILNYDGLQISPGQTTSGIVYSEVFRKYWWVSIDGSSMHYQEMTFSETGRECIAKMFATGASAPTAAEKKLLQTYALSEARVLRNDTGGISWRHGGSFTTVGVPLNFGWRFNSDGSKVTAVAIDQYGAEVTDSRLYVGTISVSEDTAIEKTNPLRYTLSISMAEQEAVFGWQATRVKIFRPISGAGYQWLETGATDSDVANAPLLSFYDDNDALQVCRYSRNTGRPSSGTSMEISGKWAQTTWTTVQVPLVLDTPISYGCDVLAGGEVLSFCGEGEAAYSIKTHNAGDGATLAIGSMAVTEKQLGSRIEFSATMDTVVSDFTLVEADHAYFAADPVPGDPSYINGTVQCVTSYLPYDPSSNPTNYYNRYQKMVSGSGQSEHYVSGESKTISAVFIAPQGCATAWYELSHVTDSTSQINTNLYAIPAQDCVHRITTNGVTLDCEFGVSMPPAEEAISTTITDAALSATTTIKCRTSYGLKSVATVTNSTGAAGAYEFFGATEAAPVVNAVALVYEDQHASNAVTNLDDHSLVKYGWPETGIRPVGWQ